jgi:hypothetical protein
VLAAVTVLALAAVLVVLAWPQLFGLQRTSPLVQFVALRGAAAVGALVLAVLATVIALLSSGARRFFASIAVLLLVFSGLQAAVLASRGFGAGGFETPAETTVTVLSWNTLGEAPGVDAVTELVLQTGADVVALPGRPGCHSSPTRCSTTRCRRRARRRC